MKKIAAPLLLLITSALVVFFYFGSVTAPFCFLKTESFERHACLKPYFEDMTLAKSAEYAVSKANEFQARGLINDCHLYAHYIGEANLHKFDDDIGSALVSCSNHCIQGCVYGVMESFVSHHKSPELLGEEIDSICEDMELDYVLHRQCVHGVGHGVLAHGYLPITDAIEMCYSFSDAFDQDTCLGGLFMENMDQFLLNDEDSLREQLPHICSAELPEDLLTMCVGAAGEGLMFYTGHNLERSEDLCELVNENYIEVCKQMAREEGELNRAERQKGI